MLVVERLNGSEMPSLIQPARGVTFDIQVRMSNYGHVHEDSEAPAAAFLLSWCG